MSASVPGRRHTARGKVDALRPACEVPDPGCPCGPCSSHFEAYDRRHPVDPLRERLGA